MKYEIGHHYESTSGCHREILALRDGEYVYWNYLIRSAGSIHSESRELAQVFDKRLPFFPLPTGYRLVTDAERKQYKKPADYYTFPEVDADEWQKGVNARFEEGVWVRGVRYCVPEGHVFEQVLEITVKINGKTVPLSSVSEETLMELRKSN